MRPDDRSTSLVRQPLNSGSAALFRFTRIGVLLTALISLLFSIQCFRTDSPIFGFIGLLIAVCLIVPAIFAIFVSAESASDVIMDVTGLRIEGGKRHGFAVRYEELDPAGLELVETKEKRMSITLMVSHLFFVIFGILTNAGAQLAPYSGDPAARLFLRTRDGRRVEIAHGVEEDEVLSLRALYEALQSRLGQIPNVDPPSEIVCCGQCGAAVPPIDAPETRCAFCTADVTIPSEIRTRINAHRNTALPPALEALIARMTRLPSARFATVVSAAVFALMLLLGVSGSAIFVLLIFADAADTFSLGFMALCSGLFAYAAWRLGQLFVVDRVALGAIGAHFGARAPRRDGEAWRCRGCGAPLPSAAGALVQCVYCDVRSVVGIDARQIITPVGTKKIEDELAARATRRSSAGKSAMVATLVGGFALFWLIVLASLGVEGVREQRACAQNDGIACQAVADSFFNGSSRRQDRDLALSFAEKSCALGNIEGCCLVLSYVEFELSENVLPKNPRLAEESVARETQKSGRSPCE